MDSVKVSKYEVRNDYFVKFKGNKVTLDDYLDEKEQEAVSGFSFKR